MNTARLLLVDDHAIVREGLRGLIEKEADLRVCGEVSSIAEGIAACSALKPDGVIVDLSLGRESGLDLIEKVRAEGMVVPILVLSMHSEALYAERALRSGASGYVMKHEATSLLLAAIREVLSGKVFVSPAVADRVLRSMSSKADSRPKFGIERLSNRELEVFRLIGMGLGTAHIADHLHISHKTVETHRARIKEKLGLENAMELVVQAATWVNGANPLGAGS